MKVKQQHISLLTSILFSCLWVQGTSQSITVVADRDRIFIGEQINLTISVQQVTPSGSWFKLPESLNHFEIVSKSKIDTVADGNSISLSQTLKITSFDSGRWQFPSLLLPGMQPSPAIAIDVLPVDVSQMQDYNEIKDIEQVAPITNWLIIAIIALVTLLSIVALIWLLRKKAVAKPGLAFTNRRTIGRWRNWQSFSSSQYQTPEQLKYFYATLNHISRQYFHQVLHQSALQQTTGEWMVDLHSLEVDVVVKTAFFQFLRLADSVKFARYLPPVYENEPALLAVKNMLQKMHLQHGNI